jgi:hypothetical protein
LASSDGWGATDVMLYLFLAIVIFFIGRSAPAMFDYATRTASKTTKKLNKKNNSGNSIPRSN